LRQLGENNLLKIIQLKIKYLLFFFLFIFLQGENLYASGDKIKFEEYSYKDGLTTSNIYSVSKDSRGFLWICSENGLYRFDGYRFRNISSLVKDFFSIETYCIYEDKNNNFLIGTSQGVFYYQTRTEKISPINLNINSAYRVYEILVLDDKIWAASDIGLILFNKESISNLDKTNQCQVLLPDYQGERTNQDNIVNTLFYMPGSSSLWVGTNGALYELDREKLTFSLINSFFQNSIRGLSQYTNKILVSSWDGGVFLVNPSTHLVENDVFIKNVNKIVGDKRVVSAFIDHRNHLWVATKGSGLYIFQQNKGNEVFYTNYRNDQKQNKSLKSDFINHMYMDDNKTVWLSMNQPVLTKIYFQKNNLQTFSFNKQKNIQSPKEILSVAQSNEKNKIWVTTNGSGLYLFDAKTQKFKQFTTKTTKGLQLQSNNISICYQDSKGNLWLVYQKIGLYFIPAKHVTELLQDNLKTVIKPLNANSLLSGIFIINSYILTIYEDSSNRLWFGSWGSLYLVEQDPNLKSKEDVLQGYKSIRIYADIEREKVDFQISPVVSIAEINKKRYWIGTYETGIVEVEELSKNNFSCKLAPVNKKIKTKKINQIILDKRNGIWMGTNSGLFYLNSAKSTFRSFTTKEGLCMDYISNVVEDDNSNIWVSTPYGLSNIQTKDLSVSNFYHPDHDKFNQYIINAGTLADNNLVCFSTNESLVFINPDSIETNNNLPPLFFTDIKIDNKTVIPQEKYNGTVVLSENINRCEVINVPYYHTLNLEFAALDFSRSKQIIYKYKIGKKSEWIQLKPGQRSLNLPNMSHGEYILSIMATKSDSNSSIKQIKINYLPPFWLSNVAYVFYVVVVLALLFFYQRLSIQKIKQKSIIEKERFEIKKLEELSKMKSEFFSNISHEYRTPLSLIINPLERLSKEQEISEKNKEKIGLILKSSERLLKLTNELMDFSKIEKKLLKPNFEICEIRSFVRTICKFFKNQADSMNFEFKFYSSFEQLEIPIDKSMIEKVVFNLLSNAFKYTQPNGMIMINLTVTSEQNNEYFKLSCINTGKGINTENLGKIFDRFYQVDNVQNRNMEGTGIGLSLVKSYVELHKGKIEVKSEPNLETSFDIYLPIQQNRVHAPEKTASLLAGLNGKETNSVTEGKKLKVKPSSHYKLLVIEDDDDIRNYIISELSPDFNILEAKNGQEGFDMANETIPDLIVTDIIMPIMSGLDLCQKLKKQVVTSHIPVLMLSAKTTVENQIEGLEMGADVYMIKPFSIEHLKAQIVRLINFKQAVYVRYLKETELIPQGAASTKLDEDFMKKVTDFIERNLLDSNLNVDQLANCVSLSKVQTYRKIKAITGMSIVEFIRTIRLKKSIPMIMEKKLNFSEIAFETGFSSPSYFSKCFHDHFGKTPSEFALEYGG
jgi:signal transduction histidine kinase/ligand-binding sensor domain-containing protein/DNA-binding response OmpR family regulator